MLLTTSDTDELGPNRNGSQTDPFAIMFCIFDLYPLPATKSEHLFPESEAKEIESLKMAPVEKERRID